MGLIFSRQNARIEEIDAISNNAYRYPNKDGNYFANHFIMGGERFETTQPEAYLFGENLDLNFLGRKPTPFPYPAPQPNEPTKTLRSLMNVRKESLRFVKTPENVGLNTSYNIEFTFDTDVRCGITIYYFCTEEITANAVVYTPRDPAMNSETYYYKKGVNQQFCQLSHVFDPSKYAEDMLCYKFEDEVIPVLIQCVAEEGEEPRQSHMVFAVVEKNADGSYVLKALKQKLFIDGLCYLLQEIYGIENKNILQSKSVMEEDIEDSGSECVICMSDARDTLILPCRHLCLCNSCADSLRYQANNCPICRAPFRALLQIRAVRKSPNALPPISGENQSSQDIPPGYELVSLIEALNGPSQHLIPSFAPPFANSPDTRHKHRYLDRNYSASASKIGDASIAINKEANGSTDMKGSSVPEVVIAPTSPKEKTVMKTESLPLGENRRHRKGFRTSSAPEKMRLLTNSLELVSELGSSKRKMDKDKDADLAETRSLLESNFAEELSSDAAAPSRTHRSCSSAISLSTPHSLHLCEKSIRDSSPGGDDSDYFTPEDPGTSIVVDPSADAEKLTKEDPGRQNGVENEIQGRKKSPSKIVVVVDEHPLQINTLLDAAANNITNHSSEESFSSSSSTRVLLRPQSYETLPE